MTYELAFPSAWVNAGRFEQVLQAFGKGLHEARIGEVLIRFPANCAIMIDTAIRLLSFVNQLDLCSNRVHLAFEDENAGVMGYLNRMGFSIQLETVREVLLRFVRRFPRLSCQTRIR